MPLHLDNFRNQPPITVIKDTDIAGLSDFKRKLERLFFSKVVIRNSATDGQIVKLVVEISCNFDLAEGLVNLDQGIWAQAKKSAEHVFRDSKFFNLVNDLREKNDFVIDVEEFSIVFNDCNVIVNKIYDGSIPEQLDAILTKLSAHFVHLAKDEIELPFEVFIPIFEEQKKSGDIESTVPMNSEKDQLTRKDYFNFWGLYFYSEDDGLIYTLESKSISSGELNMLNE